jgi:hypothetical protein
VRDDLAVKGGNVVDLVRLGCDETWFLHVDGARAAVRVGISSNTPSEARPNRRHGSTSRNNTRGQGYAAQSLLS